MRIQTKGMFVCTVAPLATRCYGGLDKLTTQGRTMAKFGETIVATVPRELAGEFGPGYPERVARHVPLVVEAFL